MKNRFLCIAMAGLMALGMISCGNPGSPDEFKITADNVDEYIVTLGDFSNLSSEAVKTELDDSMVSYYADDYYNSLALETEGLTDEDGNPVPMTDEAIAKLNSTAYSTVSEFMVFVRKTVQNYIDYSYENEIVYDAIDAIVETSTFNDLPDELIKAQEEYVKTDFQDAADSYDVSIEKYLEYGGTTLSEMAALYAKENIVYVKLAKELGYGDLEEDEMNSKVFDYLLEHTSVN